jgi:hypothetical protein
VLDKRLSSLGGLPGAARGFRGLTTKAMSMKATITIAQEMIST